MICYWVKLGPKLISLGKELSSNYGKEGQTSGESCPPSHSRGEAVIRFLRTHAPSQRGESRMRVEGDPRTPTGFLFPADYLLGFLVEPKYKNKVTKTIKEERMRIKKYRFWDLRFFILEPKAISAESSRARN